MATRVMQLAGVLTVFVLGGFLGLMWSREKRRRKSDSFSNANAHQHRSPVTEN